MTVKTDNANLKAKLDLRRYFLHKYHSDSKIDVLDCCQGDGVIWSHLRDEFPVSSYWGVDTKKKKGRLAIDSVRILQQKGWPQNVVDIDTYGSPWKHWLAMLPNIQLPATVFLTIGQAGMAIDRQLLVAAGFGNLVTKIPPGIQRKIVEHLEPFILAKCADSGIITLDLRESVVHGAHARYLGARLERQHLE